VGCEFLGKYFVEDILGPIKYHVKAKKYLAREKKYYKLLSEASKVSLKLQGGIMSNEEAKKFERNKFFENSIKLRKFDEIAKKSDLKIKSINDYKNLLTSKLI
jgi:predicted HD phosphohydrolase